MPKLHSSIGKYIGSLLGSNKNIGMFSSSDAQNAKGDSSWPSSIVTLGLVLYWDFGNLLSYPGSGTTVTDLSGNNNNGTINGSGTYNSSLNGGIYTFSATSNTISNTSMNLASSNYTVMGSAKYNGGTNSRIISAKNNNWLLGHWSGYTRQFYSEGWVHGAGAPTQFLVTPTDNNWHIWTGTGLTNYSFYDNNNLAGTNTSGAAGPNGWAINSYGPGNSELSNGSFGFLLCYNRVLTRKEMTQNYNYFKDRYDLI
jgi:hypothetical protein